MLNSRVFDYRIWVTLILSLGFGFVLNKLVPILSEKPLFLLALPLGVLFFVVLVVKPKWVLAAIILTRPLLDNLLNLTKSSNSGEAQGIGLGAILNLAIIALAVFLCIHYSTFPRRNKVVLSWFIYLFFMFLSVCYSPFRVEGLRSLFNYFSYFAMFIIPFLIIKNKEDFLFWFKVFAWSFVLPIFFANIDMIHGGRHYEDAGDRIAGTFTHPNILAFYLVLGMTTYFYILKSGYWKFRPQTLWAIRILMLNMLVLLIATKTRNAWIACFIGFSIYGYLKDKRFLFFLFLFLFLSFLVPQVKDRILTVFQDKESSDYQGMNSFVWRLHMWGSSLSMIEQKPLQGYGLDTFIPMSAQFSDVGANGAHNTYLQVLFETGIFGLLSFISLFLSPLIIFFKNMRKTANHSQARLWAILVGYVVSYIIICSADNLTYYLVFNWYVWFFIGMMMLSEKFLYD